MDVLIAVLGAVALGVLLRFTIYAPLIERRQRMRRMALAAGEATAAVERLGDVLVSVGERVREIGVTISDADSGYDELFVGPFDFPKDAPPVAVGVAETERNGDGA